MMARAVLFTGVRQVELGQVEIQEPEEGEILMQAEYTCISPGTEGRILDGKQWGVNRWPVLPGYACCGRTPDGRRWLYGGTRRAYQNGELVEQGWGGHVEWAVFPEDQLVPVPDAVDAISASAARLAAIAYRGVRMAKPCPHERVAVVGLGAVGQFSARWFRAVGCSVVCIEPNEQRRRLAGVVGLRAVAPEEAREHLPDGADIVVDCTGHPGVFENSVKLAWARPWHQHTNTEARIVVQGSYPGTIEVDYSEAFRRELSIHFPRDLHRDDLVIALDAIARGTVEARTVVSRVRDPEEAADAYRSLREDPSVITVAFDWLDQVKSDVDAAYPHGGRVVNVSSPTDGPGRR